MKIAFTTTWYEGLSAGVPSEKRTRILNVPDDIVPPDILSALKAKFCTTDISLVDEGE